MLLPLQQQAADWGLHQLLLLLLSGCRWRRVVPLLGGWCPLLRPPQLGLQPRPLRQRPPPSLLPACQLLTWVAPPQVLLLLLLLWVGVPSSCLLLLLLLLLLVVVVPLLHRLSCPCCCGHALKVLWATHLLLLLLPGQVPHPLHLLLSSRAPCWPGLLLD
jgi:hypothetical protein